MSRTGLFGITIAALLVTVTVVPVGAARGADFGLSAVPQVQVPLPNLAAVRTEDLERESQGQAPRFAIPNDVLISPATDGIWKDLDAKTRQWHLRITSAGALSLNLGFGAYYMPPGGQLWIYAADGSYALEPYTDFNNADHGELWTAAVLSDDIIVEVTIPRALEKELTLQLTSINVGYRGFGELAGDKAGSCEIDVICPSADGWRNEIPAIGVISTGGSAFCTGFMVNNTAQNQTPYFMTAHHCGLTTSNAASLVVYWNFFSPTCGAHGGGSLSTYQSGSTLRADYATSDFTLVQLSQPPNSAWQVTFAGWDARDVQASSIVGIHHPNCDEKSISFSPNATFTSTYDSDTSPGDGTHLRVNWLPAATNQGVTEPGSSGSPLFDQNHRVLGQLHGGASACGSSDMRDWYGRFYRSWTGGGTSSTRLSNWLDAGGTGILYVDTLNPYANGLQVTPSTGLSSIGDPGGPFTPSSVDYTLHNAGTTAFSYQVTKTQSWVSLTNASGSLAGGASVTVTVSINANANALGIGGYADTVTFTNTTNHQGDTTRSVSLQVGAPHVVYSWNMDTNPGWTTLGSWAWGHPTGGAGDHGGADPTNGYTGSNVYGYNLSGGYTNSMSETNLTTTVINCTGLTHVALKFWRWLGVESATYDHAYVRVSNNGSTWTTLWTNPTTTLDEQAWSQQSYDMSAVADNQATVYVRWTMGITDSSWTYCGWNIDDVEIWALSACTAPAITGQPTNQTVCSGGSASFTVTATGSPAPTYQWRKGTTNLTNGGNISGATSATLTINPVGTGDAATTYNCVATNTCGSATSNNVSLTVNPLPVAPTSAASDRNNFCTDDAGNISLSATGGSGTTLRWLTGSCTGTSIGTGNPLVIASPTATTTYYARWENTCGNSTCASVTVTVNPLPDCTITPAPAQVCANSTGNTASVPNAGVGATYVWGITNGTITAGAGTSQITYTAGAIGSVHLTVTVTTAAGCVCNNATDVPVVTCGATGACCSTSGTCAVLTSAACATASGHYFGDNSTCRPGNLCPASCQGDMNCDGRVTFTDIDLFVAALGGETAWTGWPCPWLNADANGDLAVTFTDIDPFVALIGTTCP
jgi:hypothetical protein